MIKKRRKQNKRGRKKGDWEKYHRAQQSKQFKGGNCEEHLGCTKTFPGLWWQDFLRGHCGDAFFLTFSPPSLEYFGLKISFYIIFKRLARPSSFYFQTASDYVLQWKNSGGWGGGKRIGISELPQFFVEKWFLTQYLWLFLFPILCLLPFLFLFDFFCLFTIIIIK